MEVPMSNATPEVDARDLAWWAENAHGFAGEEELSLTLCAGDDKPKLMTKEELKPLKAGSYQVLLKVVTSALPERMERPRKVELQLPNGDLRVIYEKDTKPPTGVADAMFWSASAVEKFLLPYYAAQRLYSDEDMSKLKKSFNTRGVVAIVHVAPSKSIAIRMDDPVQVFRTRTSDGREELECVGLRRHLETL
jgi:hypothetical protein